MFNEASIKHGFFEDYNGCDSTQESVKDCATIVRAQETPPSIAAVIPPPYSSDLKNSNRL